MYASVVFEGIFLSCLVLCENKEEDELLLWSIKIPCHGLFLEYEIEIKLHFYGGWLKVKGCVLFIGYKFIIRWFLLKICS